MNIPLRPQRISKSRLRHCWFVSLAAHNSFRGGNMSMTILNLRESCGAKKTATRNGSSRRSQRVVITCPVTLFGQSMDGRIFSEETNTQTVSPHGALVFLKKDVNTQKPALLGNPKTKMEVQCRVVHRKEIEKDK